MSVYTDNLFSVPLKLSDRRNLFGAYFSIFQNQVSIKTASAVMYMDRDRSHQNLKSDKTETWTLSMSMAHSVTAGPAEFRSLQMDFVYNSLVYFKSGANLAGLSNDMCASLHLTDSVSISLDLTLMLIKDMGNLFFVRTVSHWNALPNHIVKFC